MRFIVRIAIATALALPLSMSTAQAAPEPIPFCMPDLDGHCRYCEVRFAPVGVRCLG